MTTQQAFKKLTDKRGWYKKAGIHPSTARSFKWFFKRGEISEWKMSEILKSAGYKVNPATWEDPIDAPP